MAKTFAFSPILPEGGGNRNGGLDALCSLYSFGWNNRVESTFTRLCARQVTSCVKTKRSVRHFSTARLHISDLME